jgi:hypothetical protein
MTNNGASAGAQGGIVRLDDGTTNNAMLMFLDSAGNQLSYAAVGGVVQENVGFVSPLFGTAQKQATSYGGGGWRSCLRGGAPLTGSGSSTTLPATVLGIGHDNAAIAWFLNGYIRRVRYWPRAMSPAELQANTR